MAYKWKPSKSQRREFAIKMSTDNDFASQYYERKEARAERRRASSAFDYASAGGNYVPTKAQYDFVRNNFNLFATNEERNAANQVEFGYSCNEIVHHDNIHIVNEKMRVSWNG